MPLKQKQGTVVSDKMDKTVVVQVMRTKKHQLYKKYIRLKKKFMAHDEENKAHIGDTVRIVESKPISRHKRWVMSEIIREAPGRGK